jgi:hypothetical protein
VLAERHQLRWRQGLKRAPLRQLRVTRCPSARCALLLRMKSRLLQRTTLTHPYAIRTARMATTNDCHI